MDISFLDLRKNPGKILKALKRRERVTLSRRGKVVARIVSPNEEKPMNAADHPAFGMWADRPGLADPSGAVRLMRKGRFSPET